MKIIRSRLYFYVQDGKKIIDIRNIINNFKYNKASINYVIRFFDVVLIAHEIVQIDMFYLILPAILYGFLQDKDLVYIIIYNIFVHIYYMKSIDPCPPPKWLT